MFSPEWVAERKGFCIISPTIWEFVDFGRCVRVELRPHESMIHLSSRFLGFVCDDMELLTQSLYINGRLDGPGIAMRDGDLCLSWDFGFERLSRESFHWHCNHFLYAHEHVRQKLSPLRASIHQSATVEQANR